MRGARDRLFPTEDHKNETENHRNSSKYTKLDENFSVQGSIQIGVSSWPDLQIEHLHKASLVMLLVVNLDLISYLSQRVHLPNMRIRRAAGRSNRKIVEKCFVDEFVCTSTL
jgi:hypothetical protein